MLSLRPNRLLLANGAIHGFAPGPDADCEGRHGCGVPHATSAPRKQKTIVLEPGGRGFVTEP